MRDVFLFFTFQRASKLRVPEVGHFLPLGKWSVLCFLKSRCTEGMDHLRGRRPPRTGGNRCDLTVEGEKWISSLLSQDGCIPSGNVSVSAWKSVYYVPAIAKDPVTEFVKRQGRHGPSDNECVCVWVRCWATPRQSWKSEGTRPLSPVVRIAQALWDYSITP